MKKDLTLIIPTRGRPQRFNNAVDTALKHADVEVIAYVDEDDPELRTYTAPCARKVHIAVGPRIGTAKSLKKLVSLCETDWVMSGSDDIVFETPDWDKKLIAPIPEDGIGMSHSADGMANQFNHFVFHKKLQGLTGLWPDVFWHFGPDGYLGEIAGKLGRRYFVKDVMIRHLHPKFNLGPKDRTYVEARSKGNGRAEMGAAKSNMDRDIQILKAEIERCAKLSKSIP